MIIIGLGTNYGNRLENLRHALREIKNIASLTLHQVSPVYRSDAQLTADAPPEWNQDFLNCAISCDYSHTPDDLLAALKKIELSLGRPSHYERWSPRVIDLDILTWQDETIHSAALNIPHTELRERPFALWPLADIAPLWHDPVTQQTAEQLSDPWGSRFSGAAPFQTKQIPQRIDAPALMGIINVTPDSFSDGGKFSSAEHAYQQALHLIDAGAEILDVGAESTAPQRHEITTDEEWQRLEPVLDAIVQAKHQFSLSPLISVDTRHAHVAKLALSKKIDWINDVSGFSNAAMREVVRDHAVDCVAMHHLTIPPTRLAVLPRDQDPVEFLLNWGHQLLIDLEKSGIERDRIILDPGIGFGKTPGQTLMLLNNISRFQEWGVRILIGHSRKSFMGIFTALPAPDRDVETQAIAQYLQHQPFQYLRIHNVDMCARAFRVQAALTA